MRVDFPDGQVDIAGEEVLLTWEDGRKQRLSAAALRADCPCATCRNAKFEVSASMFPGIRVEGVQLVGAYALQFEYSDGHKTGAYPYRKLRAYPDEML